MIHGVYKLKDIKRIVTALSLTLTLVTTTPLFAAVKDLSQYNGFKLKKELWVCSSVAFPVDISYDAFNVNYRTLMLNGEGHFIQVKPGMHTDASQGLPKPEYVVEPAPAHAVLNVIGKPAGTYEYVFVCESDGFCGMSRGDQAVVRIYLVPQIIGFPALTNVCPGGKVGEVNLGMYVPTEIKSFLDAMGWTLKYTDVKGAAVSMPLKDVDLSSVGNTEYRFVIDDSQGAYAGKYKAMRDSVYYACPQDSATVTHTVRISEDFEIPDRKVSFCIETLLSVPETADNFYPNLYSYIGSSVENGTWDVALPNTALLVSDFWDAQQQFVVPVSRLASLINTPGMGFAFPYTVTLTYKYKDCSGNDKTSTLEITLTDDLSSLVVNQTEKDVCRNRIPGVADLSSIFGFSLPLTSGIWYQEDVTDPTGWKEMLYGAVDVSPLQTGSLYTFKYDISAAVDEGDLCGVGGSTEIFKLRIRDISQSGWNAETQICKQMFRDGVTLDLFDYVPTLDSFPNVTWKYEDKENGNATVDIPNPEQYPLKATGVQAADTSNTQLHYIFEVKTDCGSYKGNLWITAIDSVSSATYPVVMQICYTDDYAYGINLFQVLGIAGLQGTFEFLKNESLPNNKTLDASVFNPSTGILNANAAFGNAQSDEEYVFVYRPAPNESCISRSKDLKIKIRVTKFVDPNKP